MPFHIVHASLHVCYQEPRCAYHPELPIARISRFMVQVLSLCAVGVSQNVGEQDRLVLCLGGFAIYSSAETKEAAFGLMMMMMMMITTSAADLGCPCRGSVGQLRPTFVLTKLFRLQVLSELGHDSR